MPKVEFLTQQGHKRIIDSRVAAHLAKKGRGQYQTRDLVADTGVPAVVVAPVVTAPSAVAADADAVKPAADAAAASDSTATNTAAAADRANAAAAAQAVLKSNVSTAEAKARREAANKNSKRS